MPTPAQLRILHLIALAGGKSTEVQLATLIGYHPKTVNEHLCNMQRAKLVCKAKGNVWLTMQGLEFCNQVTMVEIIQNRLIRRDRKCINGKCVLCSSKHHAQGYCGRHYKQWRAGKL